MAKPFVLITNDDGIHAPGIRHLWESVASFADVAIVAPKSEKSGTGLSITWTKPLVIEEMPWPQAVRAWSVNGTPADCVKMALSVLLDRRPDMVLSGINRGSNAGRTVLYSGTIGGTIEGILKGIPGIAFSFCDMDEPPLSATKDYIVPLVRHFLEHPLPVGSLLNVNFPENCARVTKGFKLVRQGRGQWSEAPDKRTHPEGMPYYWLGGKWQSAHDEHEESDVYWLEKGYVTGVPIHVGELTDHGALQTHKARLESLFSGAALAPPPVRAR